MSLKILREIHNVRYLVIRELTAKQMVVKCNKDKFRIRQLICMISYKRQIKCYKQQSFATQNCVSITQIYETLC